MSHAFGEVFDAEGTRRIGWFEYNGTVEMACSAIAPDAATLSANWRSSRNMRECTCGNEPVPVVLYSHYAEGGFHWRSTACLHCMAITGERLPFDPVEESNYHKDGHPFPHLKES